MNFKKYSSYKEFSDITRHENRYIHNEKVVSFLNGILETSEERQVILSKDYHLCRAQLGNAYIKVRNPAYSKDKKRIKTDDPCPYPAKRMKPILNSATEGRANPKGISYLYLATDEKTAISEIRPWKGSNVSVGIFKVIQDLNIVECADFSEFPKKHNAFITTKGLTMDERIKLAVWRDIDNAFSTPVNTNDKTSDYVPTQVIAEFLKSKGFDGIAFKSSLSSGANVVLFDLKMADLVCCRLYEITDINIQFKCVTSYTKLDRVR